MTIDDDGLGPPLDVRQAGAAGGTGPWDVSFDVTNRGADPVSLIDARLPHARFHADVQDLAHLAPLAPGEAARLEFTATFDEPPGTEAGNAFVILRVRWRGDTWRVLTRMTVASGTRGEPTARPETASAHRVGFST